MSGAGPRGHCAKPVDAQCPAGGSCPCRDELVEAIILNGSPIDYGPHYSPPPTPSPGSSGLDSGGPS